MMGVILTSDDGPRGVFCGREMMPGGLGGFFSSARM